MNQPDAAGNWSAAAPSSSVPRSPIHSSPREDHLEDSVSSKSSRLNKDNPWIFSMKWAATVLAAAASVVFGIWAPLSYDMSKGNNNESNAMQTAMLESIAAANSIAQQALFTASAQAKVLQDTQAQLVAMGKLQLADYCRSYTAAAGCSAYLANAQLSSVISYLGGATSTAPSIPKETSQITATPMPRSGRKDNSLPVGAILGIVFGVMGISGLLLGVVIWQARQRGSARRRQDEKLTGRFQ